MAQTNLSVGLLIYDLLSKDTDVKNIATRVFPVVTEQGAKLPYVVYRRGSSEAVQTKGGNANTSTIEIACYAEKYSQSITLAEAVRKALDGVEYTFQGMNMRCCYLSDSQEIYDDDAYAQILSFTCKIN